MILPYLLSELWISLITYENFTIGYKTIAYTVRKRDRKKDHQGVLNKCAWLMLGVHPANFPK